MPRQAFDCYYDAPKDLYRKRIKNAAGKYISLYDRDKAKLKKKYEQAKRDVEASINISEDITVSEYAAKWFALNTRELSNARKNDYKIAINKYIAPVIGHMKVKTVLPDNVKEVLSKMDGMSRSAQSNVVIALKRIFAAAEENKLILRTPCASLRAGGYKPREKAPLTGSQAHTLIEAVAGTSAYTFVMLGLYAGLRREEILGLQWDCVHLDEVPYISVRRVLIFIDNVRPVISEKLKSKAAKRDIPIPPQLAERLREAKAKSKSDFVIADTSGKEYSYTAFRNMWGIVKARQVGENQKLGSSPTNHPNIKRTIDFYVTPHVMRHTYISNLCISGMNIKKIQYLAGHSTVNMTLNIYTHIVDNKPGDLIRDIEKAFSG